MKKRTFLLLAVLSTFVLSAHASFSDRKNKEIADSGKPIAVKGATPITVASDFATAFDSVVKALQKADENVAVADRDAGMVATEIEIEGGWKQTGTRTVVTFIKESDKETIIKIAVTVMKRYKALQVEPWSERTLDTEKTAAQVAKLKTAIGAK